VRGRAGGEEKSALFEGRIVRTPATGHIITLVAIIAAVWCLNVIFSNINDVMIN